MKKQLLILMTLFVSIIGYSQTVGDQFIDNFITYEITSLTPNTVMTRDYDFNGGGSEVIIPATVNYNSTTFDVTVINTNSFSILNNSLTKVVIPNSIVEIRSGAFFGNAFTSIVIPSSVTLIGPQALADNNALTCVIVEASTPPSITTGGNPDTFGDGGFGTTRSNINVVVPNGTSVAYANASWTGFQSLTEELAVNDTFVTDYITYKVTSVNPATVEITDYNTSGGTIVDIPETVTASCSKAYTVTEIGAGAFSQKQLTSVTIPNTVTNIKNHAFNYNLFTSIIIPESVTNIGYLAFGVNYLNTIVVLGTTPPTITTGGGNDTFANSSRPNINLVIINNATDEYVTDPGALWTGFKMVFEATSPTTAEVSHYDPANGTAVVIPASVTAGANVFDVNRIDDSAFENIGLTAVTIPNSVTEIGISAFELNNLTSVTIPDSVTLIGTTAFATNSITNLSLGANVTDISIGAFVDNNLSDITIPSNVTFIGLLAFGNNPLTSVTSFATTPPTITTGTNDTFAFNRSNIHLHIPPGTLAAYVTNVGALWTGFNPVTEDASLSTTNFELAHDIRIISSTGQVEVMHSNSIELEQYSIYNMSGAKVKDGKENTINVNTLSNGIYILQLKFYEGKIAKKFVK